jgi:hypothetical protein
MTKSQLTASRLVYPRCLRGFANLPTVRRGRGETVVVLQPPHAGIKKPAEYYGDSARFRSTSWF